MLCIRCLLWVITFLTAVPGWAVSAPPFDESERAAGGETTIYTRSSRAYNEPAAHLSARDRLAYFSGHSFFKNPWVTAPATTTARDGLGPLFNTNSCKACHVRNGRGSVAHQGLVLRLTQAPGAGGDHGEDSRYGGQLQHRAVLGLQPEATFDIGWRTREVALADGQVVTLRKPVFTVRRWHWGEPDPQTRWSARIAPPIIGLGLLEAIPEADIVALAQKQQREGRVSGRVSRVLDRRSGNTQALGRFGWKALQPTVRQQSAKAFQQDLGLSSDLYPESVCAAEQADCLAQPHGKDDVGMEVRARVMAMVTDYVRNGAVPGPRDVDTEAFQSGRRLFYRVGCADCHQPDWRTEPVAGLPSQRIWPYTDLLLHDMGEALAAQTGEGNVAGRLWRTSPLWGVGMAHVVNPQTGYLHDGRARTLLEAILWHGGEAEASREAVRHLAGEDREDLLFFLQSL